MAATSSAIATRIHLPHSVQDVIFTPRLQQIAVSSLAVDVGLVWYVYLGQGSLGGNYTRKGGRRRCFGAAPVLWAFSVHPGIKRAQQQQQPAPLALDSLTLLAASRRSPGPSRSTSAVPPLSFLTLLSEVVNGARLEWISPFHYTLVPPPPPPSPPRFLSLIHFLI